MSRVEVANPIEDLAQPSRVSRWLWTSAFFVAASLHLGAGALAMLRAPNPDLVSEDVGGLVVMEFAPLPVAPEADAPDDASTADSQAAPPAPEIEEKLSAKQDVDMPTAEASPHEAPPDLQLAQQKTLKQDETPEEGQPTEATKAEKQVAPSTAAAEAASASPPAPLVGETSAAPSEGSVAQAVETPASWRRSVIAHLGRHKRYPREARSKRMEGEAAVQFIIDRAGRIQEAKILRSSGSPVLDQAALDLLDRAQPLPALPSSVSASRVQLVAPIRYRLR